MSPIAASSLPANSPSRFHLLAKASGATCNVDSKYPNRTLGVPNEPISSSAKFEPGAKTIHGLGLHVHCI